MNVRTSAATASSASKSGGSRCRLRIARALLDAYCGLPELLDAGLVVCCPLAVVVHERHGGERRRARRGRDVRPHGPTIAELRVEVAGLLGEDPVDERLCPEKVLRSLDDA